MSRLDMPVYDHRLGRYADADPLDGAPVVATYDYQGVRWRLSQWPHTETSPARPNNLVRMEYQSIWREPVPEPEGRPWLFCGDLRLDASGYLRVFVWESSDEDVDVCAALFVGLAQVKLAEARYAGFVARRTQEIAAGPGSVKVERAGKG